MNSENYVQLLKDKINTYSKQIKMYRDTSYEYNIEK